MKVSPAGLTADTLRATVARTIAFYRLVSRLLFPVRTRSRIGTARRLLVVAGFLCAVVLAFTSMRRYHALNLTLFSASIPIDFVREPSLENVANREGTLAIVKAVSETSGTGLDAGTVALVGSDVGLAASTLPPPPPSPPPTPLLPSPENERPKKAIDPSPTPFIPFTNASQNSVWVQRLFQHVNQSDTGSGTSAVIRVFSNDLCRVVHPFNAFSGLTGLAENTSISGSIHCVENQIPATGWYPLRSSPDDDRRNPAWAFSLLPDENLGFVANLSAPGGSSSRSGAEDPAIANGASIVNATVTDEDPYLFTLRTTPTQQLEVSSEGSGSTTIDEFTVSAWFRWNRTDYERYPNSTKFWLLRGSQYSFHRQFRLYGTLSFARIDISLHPCKFLWSATFLRGLCIRAVLFTGSTSIENGYLDRHPEWTMQERVRRFRFRQKGGIRMVTTSQHNTLNDGDWHHISAVVSRISRHSHDIPHTIRESTRTDRRRGQFYLSVHVDGVLDSRTDDVDQLPGTDSQTFMASDLIDSVHNRLRIVNSTTWRIVTVGAKPFSEYEIALFTNNNPQKKPGGFPRLGHDQSFAYLNQVGNRYPADFALFHGHVAGVSLVGRPLNRREVWEEYYHSCADIHPDPLLCTRHDQITKLYNPYFNESVRVPSTFHCSIMTYVNQDAYFQYLNESFPASATFSRAIVPDMKLFRIDTPQSFLLEARNHHDKPLLVDDVVTFRVRFEGPAILAGSVVHERGPFYRVHFTLPLPGVYRVMIRIQNSFQNDEFGEDSGPGKIAELFCDGDSGYLRPAHVRGELHESAGGAIAQPPRILDRMRPACTLMNHTGVWLPAIVPGMDARNLVDAVLKYPTAAAVVGNSVSSGAPMIVPETFSDWFLKYWDFKHPSGERMSIWEPYECRYRLLSKSDIRSCGIFLWKHPTKIGSPHSAHNQNPAIESATDPRSVRSAFLETPALQSYSTGRVQVMMIGDSTTLYMTNEVQRILARVYRNDTKGDVSTWNVTGTTLMLGSPQYLIDDVLDRVRFARRLIGRNSVLAAIVLNFGLHSIRMYNSHARYFEASMRRFLTLFRKNYAGLIIWRRLFHLQYDYGTRNGHNLRYLFWVEETVLRDFPDVVVLNADDVTASRCDLSPDSVHYDSKSKRSIKFQYSGLASYTVLDMLFSHLCQQWNPPHL